MGKFNVIAFLLAVFCHVEFKVSIYGNIDIYGLDKLLFYVQAFSGRGILIMSFCLF